MSASAPPLLHVLVFGQFDSVDQMEKHYFASTRMRGGLIARAAESLGWRVLIGERFDTSPDYLYVGKIGGHNIDRRQPMWLDYIERARNNNASIVLDYTDHHCGFDSPLTEFYRNALQHTDLVVTPSIAMTKMLAKVWPGLITEIPDPCEIDSLPTRAAGPAPWRALWFGSHTNVSYLAAFLSDERNLRSLREINIVTNDKGFRELVAWGRSSRSSLSLPPTQVFDWSLPNLAEAAAASDISLIPSDPTDPRKIGVSENRLITSLQLGLVTVASPLPSYMSHQHLFVPITDQWFEQIPTFDGSRLHRREELMNLSKRFCKASLTAKWRTLLGTINRRHAIGANQHLSEETYHE